MNEKEKRASIDYILLRGLIKPQTIWERIAEMIRTLGLRFIFWDMGYSIFFTTITLVILSAVFAFAPKNYRCSAAVGVAPLMFLIITLFAETSERSCGLYELKQNCRYTIRQITALRMIFYSIAGTVFTSVIVSISANGFFEFLSLFPLCLCALFICAVLGLAILRLTRVKWAYAVYSALWIIGNLALPFILKETWEKTLMGAPIVLSNALAVTGAALLACQISKMLSEAKKYAVT